MAVKAQGTVLTFAPEGESPIVVGKLSSVGKLNPTSEEVDVTTLDTEGGTRAYMQGFRDAGSLEIEGYHDGSDAGQAALRLAYLTGEAGDVEVCFSDGTVVAFRAYVKAHTIGAAEVDGAVGFGAVLRIVSGLTVTTG